MKKYLMTGVAAIAICAAFTSCSKSGDDLYNPEVIHQQKVDNVTAEYEAAFEKAFGKVGPNVDWGFSSRAKTRTLVNVNGNLWETCPNLLSAEETGVNKSEETLVYEYVNMTLAQMRANNHNYGTDLPDDLTDFFVTHVHTGDTKYNRWDSQSNTDESKMILGSGQMNNLQIGESSEAIINNGALSATGWYHCNNFNAGSNTDWGGNTLFEESGTFDFAYHSSSDNRYHNRWIAVRGDDINSKLAGNYYICFDFISEVENGNPNTYFKIRSLTDHRIPVPGVWRNAQQLIDAGITSVTVNEYVWDSATNTGSNQDVTYTVDATDWVQDGIDNPNMVIPADDVYTDWIIRIVPARPKDQPSEIYYRVIAEDLNAKDLTDFDFNDVVFDVIKAENGKTTLKLVAAGGIYPLKIYGSDGNFIEVHEEFGATADGTTGLYPMINTGRSSYPEKEVEITGTFDTPERLLLLRITVTKPVEDQPVEFDLTANRGKAACKILVDNRFPVVPERTPIAEEQGNFTTYVTGNWKDENEKWWWIQD